MAVPKAQEVTIQIARINWELLDLSYRYEWDDPEWLAKKPNETESEIGERVKIVDHWNERKSQLLESIARRIKYESLMGRVVGPGHRGKLSSKSIYDMEPVVGVNPDYLIVSAKPSCDVRISEETRLVLREQ